MEQLEYLKKKIERLPEMVKVRIEKKYVHKKEYFFSKKFIFAPKTLFILLFITIFITKVLQNNVHNTLQPRHYHLYL